LFLVGALLSTFIATPAVAQETSQQARTDTSSRDDSAQPAAPAADDLVGRLAIGIGYGTHDVFSTRGTIARGGGPHLDVRAGLGRRLTSQDSLFAELLWQKPFITAGGEVSGEEPGEVASARIRSIIGFGLAYERDVGSTPWSVGGGLFVLYRPLDVSALQGSTEDMVQGGGLGFGVEADAARYWSLSDAVRLGASLAGGSQIYFDESERFVAGYVSARLVLAFR
jgi:hypothetical protein